MKADSKILNIISLGRQEATKILVNFSNYITGGPVWRGILLSGGNKKRTTDSGFLLLRFFILNISNS